mgnify:CR=1 FL=1
MNIEHIFNTYFEGETNFVTPNVYEYEYKKLGIKEPDQVIFLTAPFDVVNEIKKKS